MPNENLAALQDFLAINKWGWIDYAIAAMLLLSCGLGLVRGFIREMLSLASWVAAIWVCTQYSQDASALLQDKITIQPVRLAVSCAILFFATLFVGSLITSLLSQIIKKSGLSGTDRLLGFGLGLVKGAVLIAALILLAGSSHLPEDKWWRQSQLLPRFQPLANWLKDHIPPNLAAYINYR
jgi:membrane protein required for colicin V production